MRPVAEALLRREPVRRYVLWARMALEQRLCLDVRRLALAGSGRLPCLACRRLGGGRIAGIRGGGGGVRPVALCAAVKNDAERREAALRDEIPDALRSLGVCFRAGLSLMQTLEQTASEMKGPLGELFLSAALVLQTGGTASEALALFRQRAMCRNSPSWPLPWTCSIRAAAALRRCSMRPGESVESEIDLARSLKVQTAQAQLSRASSRRCRSCLSPCSRL